MSEENTILGKYGYSVPKFDGTFIRRESKVKIIDETDKSYKIEFLEFTDKRKPGDTAWVSKRKVKTLVARNFSVKVFVKIKSPRFISKNK